MAGIYIHIPFCKQRCSYCDFHFSTTFYSYRQKMVDALCLEIQNRIFELENEAVETLYFGGGTPSLLSETEFALLFTTIHSHCKLANTAEISLEANPDDITKSSLETWKKLGFNRLSIGIQSFRENDLRWMNRAHSAEEAKNCVELAKAAGFENISVDLMYGLPNLDANTWQHHIETVVSFGVQHISAYCLTVEKKTLLEKKVSEGNLVLSDEDEQSDQFEQLVATLKKAGFEHYEISNFCLPGLESRHNTSYWKGKKYLGIGPSAHSFDTVCRKFNVVNNQRYMHAIFEKKCHYETEFLTPVMHFNETILTGLRTKWGVKIDDLKSIMDLSAHFEKKIKEFEKKKWIVQDSSCFTLQNEGWLMADFIASELFEQEKN